MATIRALGGLFVHVFESNIYLIHQTAEEFVLGAVISIIPDSIFRVAH